MELSHHLHYNGATMPRKQRTTVQTRVETQHTTTLHTIQPAVAEPETLEKRVTKINFAGVKTTFEAIPNGEYESELVDVKKDLVKGETAKNKGADRLNLQFKITEEGEWYNRRLFLGCTLVPESYFNIKGAALALGDDPDVWEGEVDPEERVRSLIGNKCLVVNRQREYEGTMRDNVQTVKPLSQEQTLAGIR